MGRREPLGGTGEAGGADIPVQGAAAGQLLGLLSAEANDALSLTHAKGIAKNKNSNKNGDPFFFFFFFKEWNSLNLEKDR